MRRRNKKHNIHGHIISVPIVGALVLLALGVFGYLALDNRCHARGQWIRDLEKRYEALENERIRERAKWNAMNTPDELERRLLQHGVSMSYARPEQVVRLPALDKAVADATVYQERERSAGVQR